MFLDAPLFCDVFQCSRSYNIPVFQNFSIPTVQCTEFVVVAKHTTVSYYNSNKKALPRTVSFITSGKK